MTHQSLTIFRENDANSVHTHEKICETHQQVHQQILCLYHQFLFVEDQRIVGVWMTVFNNKNSLY